MAWTLLAASLFVVYWVYDGYGRCLWFLVALQRMKRFPRATGRLSSPVATGRSSSPDLPVTVLLTVHNEEDLIADRLKNLLASEDPNGRLRVLVASDGSTDRTNDIVRGFSDDRIQLHISPGKGKTATQNDASKLIRNGIVVFTDAGTRFDSQFISRVAECFHDETVGAVAGCLLFDASSPSSNVRSQGYYWNYELKLRSRESELGLLAVAAGAAMAVRKDLLRQMNPAIGEDCIVPLDVVAQGFRVVHCPAALAYDEFTQDTGVQLRSRIRMTLRNWQGTWSRPALLNPLRHPGYAFALWSHKLLRWLSPVFLLTGFAAALALLGLQPGLFSITAVLPFVGLLVFGGIGAAGWRVPGAGFAYSFLVANTAFLIGVLRAIRGRQVLSYRNA